MRVFFVFALLGLLLTACGDDKPGIPVPANPIGSQIDPWDYLTTRICPDGSPWIFTKCADWHRQSRSDVVSFHRLDTSGHTDGQKQNTYLIPAGPDQPQQGAVREFDYPRHGLFNPIPTPTDHGGDGGDVAVVEGDTVRFSFTQNGVPGGTVSGWWVGKNCGGHGWVLFKDRPPTGAWATMVAKLAPSFSDSNSCPKLNSALTEWRREKAIIPFTQDGKPHSVELDIIISHHYNSGSNPSARETVIFAYGVGPVYWLSSGRTPGGPTWACGGLPPWTDQTDGWVLKDLRCLTEFKIVPPASSDSYAWPPPGATK